MSGQDKTTGNLSELEPTIPQCIHYQRKPLVLFTRLLFRILEKRKLIANLGRIDEASHAEADEASAGCGVQGAGCRVRGADGKAASKSSNAARRKAMSSRDGIGNGS